MRLANIILRLENHIERARDLLKEDISEYLVYTSLAMECFQAVNSLIDLGEYIITELKLGFPSTYKEIFELLYKNKIIDKETFNAIKRLIFLRNLIAHEYYRISEGELKEMVELLDYAEILIERIREKKFI